MPEVAITPNALGGLSYAAVLQVGAEEVGKGVAAEDEARQVRKQAQKTALKADIRAMRHYRRGGQCLLAGYDKGAAEGKTKEQVIKDFCAIAQKSDRTARDYASLAAKWECVKESLRQRPPDPTAKLNNPHYRLKVLTSMKAFFLHVQETFGKRGIGDHDGKKEDNKNKKNKKNKKKRPRGSKPQTQELQGSDSPGVTQGSDSPAPTIHRADGHANSAPVAIVVGDVSPAMHPVAVVIPDKTPLELARYALDLLRDNLPRLTEAEHTQIVPDVQAVLAAVSWQTARAHQDSVDELLWARNPEEEDGESLAIFPVGEYVVGDAAAALLMGVDQQWFVAEASKNNLDTLPKRWTTVKGQPQRQWTRKEIEGTRTGIATKHPQRLTQKAA